MNYEYFLGTSVYVPCKAYFASKDYTKNIFVCLIEIIEYPTRNINGGSPRINDIGFVAYLPFADQQVHGRV